MIPIHIEFAIREAAKLLAASSRNFKSRQVAEARRLLESVIEREGSPQWPPTLPPEHHEQKTPGRKNP